MSTTSSTPRLDALLCLAAGMSQREAAAEVGVPRSTIARWWHEPVFVQELASVRQLLAAKLPAEELLSAVEAIGVRLTASGCGV